MNPPSASHYREAREARLGTTLENLVPASGAKDSATWGALVAGLDKLASIYTSSGPWLLGDKFSFPDTITVGYLVWMKRVCGAESEEWKTVEASGKGHWKNQVEVAEREWLGH